MLTAPARADATRVRSGADRAIVEGRFSTDELDQATAARIGEILDSSGADRDDDGSIIAMRTVSRDGPSRAYLGGRSVPAKSLAALTAGLLTLHGQNDQLRLMRPDEQRGALDRFAGVQAVLERYRKLRDEGKVAAVRLEVPHLGPQIVRRATVQHRHVVPVLEQLLDDPPDLLISGQRMDGAPVWAEKGCATKATFAAFGDDERQPLARRLSERARRLRAWTQVNVGGGHARRVAEADRQPERLPHRQPRRRIARTVEFGSLPIQRHERHAGQAPELHFNDPPHRLAMGRWQAAGLTEGLCQMS